MERHDVEECLRALVAAPDYVFALLNGRYGRSVGGGSADSEFLKFVNQGGFVISGGWLAIALLCHDVCIVNFLAVLHVGQESAFGFFGFFGCTFAIDFQESVEQHHFAHSRKFAREPLGLDGGCGLFEFSIGHLAGHGALPNELVEPAFLRRAFNAFMIDVGGTNGFVGLLRAFSIGVVLAHFVVGLAHLLFNEFARGAYAERGKVGRVGSHVGNVSCLIERLRNAHGERNGVAQFARCLLLEG